MGLSRNLFVCGMVLLAAAGASGGELDKSAIRATASVWEQKAHGGVGDFPPGNTLDGDLSAKSSWRAEGDGVWIQYDLGAPVVLGSLSIVFVKGAERQYDFEVQGSATGEAGSWKPLLARCKSGGKSGDAEKFAVSGDSVRYVRIVGYGNSSEKFPKWTNIVEVGFSVK